MVERIPSKNDVKKTMVFENVKIDTNTKYQYHLVIPKKDIVLEQENWSEEEWKTILKVFNVDSAGAIKVSSFKLFGALKGE
jgi:hypothetical protein